MLLLKKVCLNMCNKNYDNQLNKNDLHWLSGLSLFLSNLAHGLKIFV